LARRPSAPHGLLAAYTSAEQLLEDHQPAGIKLQIKITRGAHPENLFFKTKLQSGPGKMKTIFE
jgi:hypothetical protein